MFFGEAEWFFYCITGSFNRIVQPKKKILPSFTDPPLVPNLYEFLSPVILKNVGNQLTIAIDLYSIFSMEVNGYQQLFGYHHSSNYLLKK